MRRVLIAFIVLLVSAAMPCRAIAEDAAGSPPPGDEPWDKTGTGAGAIINGVQSVLKASEIDGDKFDPSKVYQRYADSYGPYLDSLDIPLKPLIKGPVLSLIKVLFIVAVSLMFLALVFAANKGQANVNELSWGMSKTVIAIIFVSWPGAVYTLTIAMPVVVVRFVAQAGGSSSALRSGTALQAQLDDSINQGMHIAAAEVKGAMAAVETTNTDAVCRLTSALNKFASNTNGSPSNELVALPPQNSDQSFNIKDLKPDEAQALSLKTKQDFARLMSAVDSNWAQWKDEATRKKITDLGETARKDLADLVTDASLVTERLKKLRISVLEAARDIYYKGVLEPGTTTSSFAHALQNQGMAGSAGFVKANEDTEGGPRKFVTWISNTMMGWFMPVVARAWMIGVELAMLNLMLCAVGWVHPRTEKSAVKSYNIVMWVAFFLPIYLAVYILIERACCAMMPGAPGGFVSAIFWPTRALYAAFYALLSPIVSLVLTFFIIKAAKNGGTLLGVGLKTALTSAGFAATMAVPGLRLAGMAATKHMSAAAATASAAATARGTAASAASETADKLDGRGLHRTASVARTRALGHRGAAVGLRGLSKVLGSASTGVDYGQDAIGKAFGANDKYMNRVQTRSQRVSGLAAAMRQSVVHGTKAVVAGGHTSDIIRGIEKHGEEREERKKLDEQRGNDETARDSMTAQKTEAVRQTQLMERLVAALESQSQRQTASAGSTTISAPAVTVAPDRGTPIRALPPTPPPPAPVVTHRPPADLYAYAMAADDAGGIAVIAPSVESASPEAERDEATTST